MFRADWTCCAVIVHETTDSSLLIAHITGPAMEDECQHELTIIPGPAVPHYFPASIASVSLTMESCDEPRVHVGVSIMELPLENDTRVSERAHGDFEISNWVTAVIAISKASTVEFIHARLGVPDDPTGWIADNRECGNVERVAIGMSTLQCTLDASWKPIVRGSNSKASKTLYASFRDAAELYRFHFQHASRGCRPERGFVSHGQTSETANSPNPSGRPLQIALRVPANFFDAETGVGNVFAKANESTCLLLDYQLEPLCEGGQLARNGEIFEYLHHADVLGYSISPKTLEPGLMRLVKVYIKAPHEILSPQGTAFAIVIHVPLRTGLAQILFHMPWERGYSSRRIGPPAGKLNSGDLLAKATSECGTAPWLPQQTITSVSNGGMLEEGESVTQFTHPWLLQDLLGFWGNAEEVAEKAQRRWQRSRGRAGGRSEDARIIL